MSAPTSTAALSEGPGPEPDSRWDRLGVAASVLCAAHCLAAPLLFLAVPKVAGIWAHPSSHALIALLVLPLAGTVLLRGYRLHRKAWVASAAAVGCGCVVVGSALPFLDGGATVAAAETASACAECCPQLVEDDAGAWSLDWPAASIVSIVGSALLVASHLGNLACSRRCCAS